MMSLLRHGMVYLIDTYAKGILPQPLELLTIG